MQKAFHKLMEKYFVRHLHGVFSMQWSCPAGNQTLCALVFDVCRCTANINIQLGPPDDPMGKRIYIQQSNYEMVNKRFSNNKTASIKK